jgi:hypothetical protein
MTGEIQDDFWIARYCTLILAMAVMFADSPWLMAQQLLGFRR